jgi:hypothetical protein
LFNLIHATKLKSRLSLPHNNNDDNDNNDDDNDDDDDNDKKMSLYQLSLGTRL